MSKPTFVDEGQWRQIMLDVLTLARREGASSAEVSASVSDGFSVNVRLGEVETVEYHRDKSLDIVVYFGQQQGIANTTDVTPAALEAAVKAACQIAKVTSPDPYHGLADPALLAHAFPDLDLYHPWPVEVPQAIEIATTCENYGRNFDKRITNSEGAALQTFQHFHIYANTNQFAGCVYSTRHSMSCALLAEIDGQKERDYEFTSARAAEDLFTPQYVGEQAAQHTVGRLQARRLSTRQTPVIFLAPVATGVFGHFIAALRGSNLYLRSSFLVDHLGKSIFPSFIHIHEAPHLKRGLGSAPFDNEGVTTRPSDIIQHGVLQRYVLDSYSARKLGMTTTGNAGGIHNVLVQPTGGNLAALLKQMDTGLLVTEVMGQGVNIVTGDYSRGAVGFWVEGGEIQYPVHEITIAGNLRDMFKQARAVGNDVDHRHNIQCGSLWVENMTVAGE